MATTMPPGGLPPIIRPPVKPLTKLAEVSRASRQHWNDGHEALSAASSWLSNAAREGRRTGDRMTNEDVLHTGALTLRELRGMSLRARRLVASSGALTARELRKASQEDQELFCPLNKDEREMKRVLQLISQKAAQKFSTVRNALRHLDADCDGTVDRSEIRYFFRAYDFPDDMADRFFDYLDEDKRGELDYGFFVNFIRPFLEGALNGNPLISRDLQRTQGAPDSVFEEMTGVPADCEGEVLDKFKKDFPGILALIGKKAEERFGSVAAAFRFVDSDRSGSISRNETRYFFRVFNLPSEVADRFHDAIDSNRSGAISLQEFAAVLGPYIKSDPDRLERRQKKDQVRTPDTATPPPRECSGKMDSDLSASRRIQHVDADFRHELRKLMQDIGDKLPLKFKHMRDAFHCLDLERNGRITRNEMRSFFRGFGHDESVADKIFDLLDEDKKEEIDFSAFMSHFDLVLGPAFRQAKRLPLIPVEDARLSKEVDDIAKALLERLTTKYRNVQEAFRALDLNKDGKASQYEMRVFVKKFGMQMEAADKFFHALDTDCDGYVMYNEFMQIFGGISARYKSQETLLRRLN